MTYWDVYRWGLRFILAMTTCKRAPIPDEPVAYDGLYEWRIDAGYCLDNGVHFPYE